MTDTNKKQDNVAVDTSEAQTEPMKHCENTPDSWTLTTREMFESQRHPNTAASLYKKKRQHPILKINRVITACALKRNAFAAAVVRVQPPLTTQTQIPSHTHTPLTTHTRAGYAHTHSTRHVYIIHDRNKYSFARVPISCELFNIFFRRTFFVDMHKEFCPVITSWDDLIALLSRADDATWNDF